MTKTPVNTVDELIAILKTPGRTYHDFAMQLGFNMFSKKEMALNEDGTIFILNNIDGTVQNLTPEELFDPSLTNIGDAITRQAFTHLIY